MAISLLKAILVGIAVSMPLGPAGVLVVKRTLSSGKRSGFSTALGIATIDTIYALLSLLCLSIIDSVLAEYMSLITFIGGIIITIVGLIILFNAPISQIKEQNIGVKRHIHEFFQGCGTVLSNPGDFLLISGAMAFAHISATEMGFYGTMIIVAGFVAGALMWWFSITSMLDKFKNIIYVGTIETLNRVAGILITLLGILATIRGAVSFF
ncbi:MAG: LysE family transporter [Bacteroidales bacterium]|nr:LysE family transporter [Bacteroidales bacterium]